MLSILNNCTNNELKIGVTGKSVARSYSAALDMLIPEDAPIDSDKSTTSKTAAADRYVAAMNYLTRNAPKSSKSVIDVYVEKQEAYSEAMNNWEKAKAKTRCKFFRNYIAGTVYQCKRST